MVSDRRGLVLGSVSELVQRLVRTVSSSSKTGFWRPVGMANPNRFQGRDPVLHVTFIVRPF